MYIWKTWIDGHKAKWGSGVNSKRQSTVDKDRHTVKGKYKTGLIGYYYCCESDIHWGPYICGPMPN